MKFNSYTNPIKNLMKALMSRDFGKGSCKQNSIKDFLFEITSEQKIGSLTTIKKNSRYFNNVELPRSLSNLAVNCTPRSYK